jgi:hypothetical protein
MPIATLSNQLLPAQDAPTGPSPEPRQLGPTRSALRCAPRPARRARSHPQAC